MPLSHWFNRISVYFVISFSVLATPAVLQAAVHHAGATQGSFSVSNGNANYSVPIEVPPGMAGMEPSVSLNYSSGSGNGLVGMGWSIGGLSQINRCPTNMAKDGYVDGVDFDNNDHFCLDGQRLVPVYDDWCDDGCSTVYRTEIDSFYKIVSFGSRSDPSHFKVRTQSGQIKYYGTTADSRIEAEGRSAAHIWAINRVEDSVGNYLTYKYYEDNANGYSRIDRIDYTGNSRAGLVPSASIVFEFEYRSDITQGFMAGSVNRMLQRLSSIKTYSGSIYQRQALVKKYGVSYMPYNYRLNLSKLDSIEVCDYADVCLPAVKFDWLSDANSPYTVFKSRTSVPVASHTYLGHSNNTQRLHIADFNGDGRPDILNVGDDHSNRRGFNNLYLSNGRGFDNAISVYPGSNKYLGHSNRTQRLHVADFNGDGKADLLNVADDHSNSRGFNNLYLSNGRGFNSPISVTPAYGKYLGHSNRTQRLHVADFNGDGMADILNVGNDPGNNRGFNNLYLSTGWGFRSAISVTPAYGKYLGHSNRTQRLHVADFNGDGKADLLNVGNDPGNNRGFNNLYLSTGWGFRRAISVTPAYGKYLGHSNRTQRLHVADFNGDGLADILNVGDDPGNNRGFNNLYLANGWGFSSAISVYPGYGKYLGHSNRTQRLHVADFNGDGLADILNAGDDASNYRGFNNLYLSNGSGFENARSVYPGYGKYLGHSNNTQRLHIDDFNGDGKMDLLNVGNDHSDGRGFNNVYLSTGTGFNSAVSVYPGYGKYLGHSNNTQRLHIADFNGDGMPDLLNVGNDPGNNRGFNNLYFNNRAPNLVSAVTSGSFTDVYDPQYNTLANRTLINYSSLVDNRIYRKYNNANTAAGYNDLIPSMQVVSSYSKSDGIGGRYSYGYKYEGLKSHRLGYGSMGFAKVTMTDNQTGIKSIVNNHQTYPLNGKPSSDQTVRGNVTLSSTSNNWQVSKTHGGRITVIQLKSSSSVAREINTNRIVKRTTTTNTYDTYNNVTRIVLDTRDGYQKITNNTYQAANIYKWFTGRLSRASVTNVTPTGTGAPRTSRFEYDYYNGLLRKEVVEPNNPDLYKETRYSYDIYGNKASITVSGHSAAKHRFASRVTRSRYVPNSIGTAYPRVETTNHLGHKETKTYDARFGNVVTLVGPNGLATRWQYDTLGRQTREIRADGTYTTRSYDICESNCDYDSSLSITTQDFGNNKTSASPPATVYFDGKGREKVSTTIGFDGRLICKESHYDRFGRVSKVSQPYYAYLSGSCNLGSGAHQYTLMQYDVLGRVTKTIAPDRSYIRSEYRGLQTTTINDYEQRTVRLKNSQDQLIKVTDDAGNSSTYQFDPYGNMIKVKDAAGNITRLVYNLAGQKTQMIDPNMGHWYYEHNALGELVKQTDAKRQVVTMQYDTLGRMLVKNTPDGSSYWTYDPPGALGNIDTVRMNGLGGFQRSVDYDRFIRPVSTTTRYGGNSYTLNTEYDRVYSRVVRTTYPGITPFGIDNYYTANGYLEEIRDSNSRIRYWKLNRINARGQTVKETYGNGVTHSRSYDGLTGRVSNLSTGKGGNIIQALGYEFDTLGNLVQRRDNVKNIIEDSDYDNLSRLTATTVSGSIPTFQQSYVYDSIGNLKYKSDVGSYVYGQNGNGPHQVTRAGGVSYNYDANGNQISGDGRTISYNSFNKPKTVRKGGTKNTYAYDSEQNRIHKISETSKGTSRTFYLGKAYEKTRKPSGVTEHTYYVGAGSATVKITKRSNSRHDTRYMHTDHIGSIDAITNEYGQVVEQNSFSAWGQRRYSNWQQPVRLLISSLTTRGFTGHEMEDEIGLINMNARLYDARLGRFLQADTFIQFAESTQGFNRYTYVNNNPLSFTDPTGHFSLSSIVRSIVNVVTFPIRLAVKIHQKAWAATKRFFLKNKWAQQLGAIAAAYFGGPWGAALFQGYMTHIQGGSWSDVGKSIAISFVSSMAYGAVGDLGGIEGVMANGMIGGVTTELQGGSFKDGFLGAAVGKVVTMGAAKMNITSKTGQFVATTLGGGLAAEAGGGKFADGAQSAAMGYLFNQTASAVEGDTEAALDMGSADSDAPGCHGAGCDNADMMLSQKGKNKGKITNPNKKPAPEHRQKGGNRERNIGHQNGEEHSRRPKGGIRLRVPGLPFLPIPWEAIEYPPVIEYPMA